MKPPLSSIARAANIPRFPYLLPHARRTHRRGAKPTRKASAHLASCPDITDALLPLSSILEAHSHQHDLRHSLRLGTSLEQQVHRVAVLPDHGPQERGLTGVGYCVDLRTGVEKHCHD